MDAIDKNRPVEYDDVAAGRLPARYGYRMQDVFLRRVAERLMPGMRVLDVGGGRSASIPVAARPEGVRYVGLDVSATELEAAAPGIYDDVIVHDITRPLADSDAFDLVVSWQVLEHVRPLPATLEHLRAALAPGGTMVAQLSGTFALFSLASQLLPHPARVRLMSRFLGHPEEAKFPTSYDRCWASALDRALGSWSTYDLTLFFRGATYLSMSRPLQRLYLGYENAVSRREMRNLATHYLITATR